MKIQEMFPLQFVINLRSRTDRLEQCKEEFKKINLDPRLFTACEHEDPKMGCLNSHLALLRYASIFKQNILIFEDDVEFIGENSQEVIESALDELSELDRFDMVYLGGNVLNNIYQMTTHLGRLTHCQSTHAYGVNVNFVDKLIADLENYQNHIDVMYAWNVVPKNKCYITIPMVAIQRASYSDILKQEIDYSVPMARYEHYLVRSDE